MDVEKALDNIGKLLVSKAKLMAKKDKTYATGKFADSFKYVVEDEGSLLFFSDDSVANYSKYVVEGTKPARREDRAGREAKYNRIIDWAKAKGIRPRDFKTGKFMSYKTFAGILSKSIARKGIIKRYNYKGSNLVNRMFEEVKSEITDELNKAFSDKINEEIKIIFENGGNTQ